MITIRRLYQYVVCFIALQAAANALNALLGGVVSWVVGADPPNAVFFTFQLAIIIVATPIFLGHWLWARYLARRDPAERGAVSHHLYLYATQTMFLIGLAGAVFGGAQTVAQFVFQRATTDVAVLLQGVSFASLLLMGALWFYHHWLAGRPDLPQSDATRSLYQLYIVGWAAAGTVLVAVGGFMVQAAVIQWLARSASLQISGPVGVGLVAAGLPLWAYHEWHRTRTRRLAASLGGALRWLAASGFSAAGVILMLFSLADLLTRLAERVFGGDLNYGPAYAVAALTVGLGLWGYHEWVVRRVQTPAFAPLRWLFALAFSAFGLLLAAPAGVAALQWLFTGLGRGASFYAAPAAPFWPGLLVFAYHQWVWRQTGRGLGLDSAEPRTFRSEGRFVRRLYLLACSGVGVTLATLGLIGVQDALFSGAAGRLELREALAWLLVGLPLWLYHWLWAGRLFAAGLPDERRSDLRKIYLYVIIFAAVNTAIVTAGLTLQGLFRRLLGLPTEGQLGFSVAVIVAALALWVYHALVLRGDIARAAESSLQGGLQRLYWYLVATFGLAAFLVGLAGVLSAVITILSAGFRADEVVRGQLAQSLAALLAGFPVWLLAWWPAQAATRAAGPAGVAARRSWLRRLYLYGFALTAVIVTLVGAISVVYQILNAVFRLAESGDALANMARAAGFAVIFTAVWLYHVWVLRQDGRHATADRAMETEKRAAERATAAVAATAQWAGVIVAVVDDGDGRFARLALAALRRDLPSLTLRPVGLTPAAAAALAAEPHTGAASAEPPADRTVFAAPAAAPAVPGALTAARLIVAPWTAAALPAIAGSALPKVIVPLPGPGLYWAGLNPEFAAALPSDPGPQLARTVEVALKRLPNVPAPKAAAPVPAVSAPPPPAPEPPPAPGLTDSENPTTT